MINLYTKIFTKGDSEKGLSSILLRDNVLEITCPNYKGGSPTTVAYTDIKDVSVSIDDVLTLKIKRTVVLVGKFSTEEIRAISIAIQIGKTKPVGKSKEWANYEKKAEKREHRIERRNIIADSISGLKDGILETLKDSPEEIAKAKREEEIELQEEKAKKQRINKIRGTLESLRISLSDSEEEANRKLDELGKLCHSIIYGEDKYDDVSSEALSVYKEGIEIVRAQFPNSDELTLSESRIQKLKEQDKKNNSNVGCIIAAIAIMVIVPLVWWWLENH